MSLLKCKTLKNGVQMPMFGLGTWQMRDKDQCIKSVLNALSLGVRLIDTASVYKNEEFIGEALRQFEGFNDGKLKTANSKNVFITSKASTEEMGHDETYEACLRSLERLGVPALDLYLLHWPGSNKVEKNDPKNAEIRKEAWSAAVRLYKEGKVRAIGVSNYLSHHLEQLAKDCPDFIPHVNQVELHPFCQNLEMRKTAEKLGVAVQAYSSLGTGEHKIVGHPVVLEIAKQEKKTPSQVLLRWAVQQGLLIIPKSTNKDHIKENCEVMDDSMALSEESMNKLNNINDRTRVCWNPEHVA